MARIPGCNWTAGANLVPVALSGPPESIWNLHPAGSGAPGPAGAVPVLTFASGGGGPVSAATLQSAGTMLRPFAASVGGIAMTNTYEVLGPAARQAQAAAQSAAANSWVTETSFGPLTNSSVMPVSAIPVPGWPQGQGPQAYQGYRPPTGPQPIPETAFGYIATENQAFAQGMQSLQGPGWYGGVASWPTSSFIVDQAGWNAGPWTNGPYVLGTPLTAVPVSAPCACSYTSQIPGVRLV
jgi:hypothetical protein